VRGEEGSPGQQLQALLGYTEVSYVEKATIRSESNVWMRILI
jgi:hypothetical protein